MENKMIHKIENEHYSVTVKDGTITEFYDKSDLSIINLAGNMNLFGRVGFTFKSDDITSNENSLLFKPYRIRMSEGYVTESSENTIALYDSENDIHITYKLTDGLELEAITHNKEISQFGINLELNFLGKLGTSFQNQILPTSPYTSLNKDFMYCIMTRIDGGFLVCASLQQCDGWKIDYSTEYFGHYIENFSFLASFDRQYGGSNRKQTKVYIKTADTIQEAYSIIHSLYKVPYCTCVAGGNFAGEPVVKVSEDTDKLVVITPDNQEINVDTKNKKILKLPVNEQGFYSIIPYSGTVQGIDGCVWYSYDMNKLFDLSCISIRKPYHGDVNLCEGGCFLWSMLLDMRLNKNLSFDPVVKTELSDIMGKNGTKIKGKTIVPYKTENYAAYHLADSKRVQSQFFGVSILMEAYKMYGDEEYLDYAISALNELIDNWMTEEGMIFNGEDYTTVCAPVITVVDMANLLTELQDERAEKFKDAAIRIAEFLLNRGLAFPTEGVREDTESDAEDGSVSCTALSLLYVCANLHYDIRYIDFAKKVLDLHKAWWIYSPDVKMNGSSFRWWETIWEGDSQGPAICAGHAWTIWKAEALYWYGVLTCNEAAMLESWNGFMSNFAKTNTKGEMYSCYEPDYIRGGGDIDIKKNMPQLKGEDLSVKFNIAHNYPDHKDNSLSRYVWVRNAYTWYNTAAIIEADGLLMGLNVKSVNDEFMTENHINNVFVGRMQRDITLKTTNDIKLISCARIKVLSGCEVNGIIKPTKGIIKLSVSE